MRIFRAAKGVHVGLINWILGKLMGSWGSKLKNPVNAKLFADI